MSTEMASAELAVQSQQRRWDDGTRHSQLQPALSSVGTDKWVLSWRSNEASDSSGDRRAMDSQFQVLGPGAAKLRWPSRPPSPGHQEDRGDCRARLATTVRSRSNQTQVGQVTLQIAHNTSLWPNIMYLLVNSSLSPHQSVSSNTFKQNIPFLQILTTAAFLFLLQDRLHDSPDFYCYC